MTSSNIDRAGIKLRGAQKVIRIIAADGLGQGAPLLNRKPSWVLTNNKHTAAVLKLKAVLRETGLHTVCEEARCPNVPECFAAGTATFMILGDICTRRCPFCEVAHGRPNPLDGHEPSRLAGAIANLGLRHVVITSVDRDDLRDGGAAHFVECIRAIRRICPTVQIEILTPDFRGRLELALDVLAAEPPDVFNHNLETVARLYRRIRPGGNYMHSLHLLRLFGDRHPHVPTKSGLMLGLGETPDELSKALIDLRNNAVSMLTLGQYLQPSTAHLPVERYVSPSEFEAIKHFALNLGFRSVEAGPLVRSSYHAERQAAGPEGSHLAKI